MINICPDGHEGPNCPCNFCRGMKTALGQLRALDCSDCTRSQNLTIKPCACSNCRQFDKRYCEDCSRICLGCGNIYCEKVALEILAESRLPVDAPFRCENCQFDHDEALLEKFAPQMELGLAGLTGRTA